MFQSSSPAVISDRPILVLHTEPADCLKVLQARFPEQQFEMATHGDMIPDVLAATDPEIVFSVSGPAFSRDSLRAVFEHPSVAWVQIGGSGYDHLPEWDRSKVQVTHCAGVLAQSLAETITGAMLAINGHFLSYRALQTIGDWRPMPFRPLAGQTLLVVGFGAIGQRLAHNAKALGMKVLATRNTPADHPLADAVYGPDRDTLMSLLPQADVVSLHLRFDATTKRSFDAQAFAAMKQGAIFINTARGKVVDQQALTDTLYSGKLMGAYLDVFDREPLAAEDPLWRAPNTLITPHTADNIVEFTARYADFFALNMGRYITGEPLDNRIR
jgi:phosphoglycerate dehydrogenase-like enzyme